MMKLSKAFADRIPDLIHPSSSHLEWHLLLQSGCLNCVWEIYRLELDEYNRELAKRQGKPPPKAAADPFAELERKLEEQKRQREELESSAPKAAKRTGNAQDAP